MTRQTKIAKCPKCCPEGGACFKATTDWGGEKPVSVWECQNCFHTKPRLTRKQPDEHTPLTRKQLWAITAIQQAKLTGNKEVKFFSVRQIGSFATVTVEVGMKNDEGTMASILCRDKGHFYVRSGGKILAADPIDENKSKANEHPLIYGWRH